MRCACGLVVYDAFFMVLSCAFGTVALVRVLALTSLDLSHTLPADLFRRHARSPKGHNYPATIIAEGETVNIRVGQASVLDVRRAICQPADDGTLWTLCATGI